MEEVDKWRIIESLIAGLSEIAREVKELEAATTETNDEHTSDENCKTSYAGLLGPRKEKH